MEPQIFFSNTNDATIYYHFLAKCYHFTNKKKFSIVEDLTIYPATPFTVYAPPIQEVLPDANGLLFSLFKKSPSEELLDGDYFIGSVSVDFCDPNRVIPEGRVHNYKLDRNSDRVYCLCKHHWSPRIIKYSVKASEYGY